MLSNPLRYGLFLGLTLCVGSHFAIPATALDKLSIPNGDLQGKRQTDGFAFKGRDAKIETVGEKNKALLVGPGAEVTFAFKMPEAIKGDGMDPEAWFGRITCDVLACRGKGRVEIALARKGKRKAIVQSRHSVASADFPELGQRLELLVPAARMKELVGQDLELQVELKAAGTFALTLDEFAFERYHEAPTRKMLGKPNGKLGPDWLASGALGFHAVTEHGARAFSICSVQENGPAAKAGLQVGDVVIGIEGQFLPPSSIAPGWDWFEASHEARLGRALDAALTAGRKSVALTVLREKTQRILSVEPEILRRKKWRENGDLLHRGPLDDVLREDLIAWVVRSQTQSGGWPKSDVVNAALGGLALLGTRDKAHRKAIAECQEFLLKKSPTPKDVPGFAYWGISFHGWFFAEHYLATGDKKSLAWVKEAVEWLPSTTHESKWGTQAFGHDPGGLPYDNKALTAPAAHLLVLDGLARRCGLESKVWEHIQPYMQHAWSDPANEGHGGMGYNGSHRDRNEFWSRSGLTALAEHLRGGEAYMRMPLTRFMLERHPWMLNSHAYGEPGGALGLLSLAVVDRGAFEALLPKYRWRFLNAWEPGYGLRWSTPHMGSPYMGEDEIMNLSYALLSAVQNGGLVMAGGEAEDWLR